MPSKPKNPETDLETEAVWKRNITKERCVGNVTGAVVRTAQT